MKRPLPDPTILIGAAAALFGFLLPWFKVGTYTRWYSGWNYLTSTDGAGWSLLILAWLAVVAIAGVWARRIVAAAMTAVVAAIGTLIFSMIFVAVSFARTGDGNLDNLTTYRLNVGLPLLAIGLGLMLAAGMRSIAFHPPVEVPLSRR